MKKGPELPAAGGETGSLLALVPGHRLRDFDRVFSVPALIAEQFMESRANKFESHPGFDFISLSVIFLPLTLIAGWYGMNFDMPEYRLSFGYPLVAGASLTILIVCLILFKRKKWF